MERRPDQALPPKYESEVYLCSIRFQIHSLRLSLRNANLQAKANMKKAAQQEVYDRIAWRTKVGMTSAAESITESLRCTWQLMVQVERSASTLMTFEESTGVLRKAESEYKGHRSLFSRTRSLLSTMRRQDVLDRVIIVVGFLIFSLAVLYVVSKRVGVLKLQRKVVAAIRAGMVRQEEIVVPMVGRGGGLNVVPVHKKLVPPVNIPLEQPMHYEL
ncbi:hypothetical protein BUALT_Bualt05G0067000 [Buddleja alternifolia]|uniref:Sec20 C-terminal domain-containing protein n=1 Tax=Buddleja alternifolia TaxID=168488 RepID=A0AAV6XIP7_9LAMI|nr:hypothetical protein BUALT_Bualt05G0067000 [Buddleja alternifolia]